MFRTSQVLSRRQNGRNTFKEKHSCLYISPILPLRKNLLGLKRKANNHFLNFIICFCLALLGQFSHTSQSYINPRATIHNVRERLYNR